MQPYGKKKLGPKLHPHNECGICSEQSIQKGAARQKAKKELTELKRVKLEEEEE